MRLALHVAHHFSALFEEQASLADYASIDVPTLIICGTDSPAPSRFITRLLTKTSAAGPAPHDCLRWPYVTADAPGAGRVHWCLSICGCTALKAGHSEAPCWHSKPQSEFRRQETVGSLIKSQNRLYRNAWRRLRVTARWRTIRSRR